MSEFKVTFKEGDEVIVTNINHNSMGIRHRVEKWKDHEVVLIFLEDRSNQMGRPSCVIRTPEGDTWNVDPRHLSLISEGKFKKGDIVYVDNLDHDPYGISETLMRALDKGLSFKISVPPARVDSDSMTVYDPRNNCTWGVHPDNFTKTKPNQPSKTDMKYKDQHVGRIVRSRRQETKTKKVTEEDKAEVLLLL